MAVGIILSWIGVPNGNSVSNCRQLFGDNDEGGINERSTRYH